MPYSLRVGVASLTHAPKKLTKCEEIEYGQTLTIANLDLGTQPFSDSFFLITGFAEFSGVLIVRLRLRHEET